MDRGEIVEVGPHDVLMQRQGAYWRLYQAQQRQADEEDGALSAGALAERSAVAALGQQSHHAAHPAGDA